VFIIGRQAFGESLNPTADQAVLLNYYNWNVNWFHKSGGRKKSYFIGMDNVPIQELSFEKNKKVCGSGKIKMAFADFPIDSDDYIEAYYKGTLKYRALVDNSVDPKGGDVKLVPYSKRYSELLVNENYSSQSIESILQDLVEDSQTDTGIGYNSAFVDSGESDNYSYNFNYKDRKGAIDQTTQKLDSRWWGVLPSNIFTLYANNSSIDYILTDETERAYQEVKRTVNYERIKETRREVFKKDTAGNKEYIGQVGFGGSYPALPIENLVRKKVKTYDVSESNLSSGDALSVAYEDLKKIATYGETIQIKELDINRYDLDIGDRIQVVDGYEKVLETIIDCDSSTNWTNANVDTTEYVEGTGSIEVTGYDPTTSTAIYNFGEIMRYNNPDFIQFMVKVDSGSGNILEYAFSNNSSTLWDSPNDIYVNASGVWQIVQFDCTNCDTFQYFGIRYKTTVSLSQRYFNNIGSMMMGQSFADAPSDIPFNIDRIQIYHYSKNIYDGNVVQINYKVDKYDTHVNVNLNDYDEQSTDDTMILNRRVEKIDTIQKQ
jgi:hypothetical protein